MKLSIQLVLGALLASHSVSWACGSNEYEQCYSICAPDFLGGHCLKDCKCLPKVDGPVGQAAEQGKAAVNAGIKEVQKFGDNTLTTVKKAGGDIVKTLEKTGGDTVTTLEKAGGDTINTFAKAGKDAAATYVKGWRDTAEQTKKSFQDTVEAANAITNYTANQVKSYESILHNAEKRLREGKVIDTMWGLSIEPLQANEANFAKATQESKLIAAAASSAAAIYGGPGGAAAYAAWSTYRATGNADQALRAGLLAAATAQVGTNVSSMPTGTAAEVVKKVGMAGAAGGIAVAAAGGDEKAITEGFLRSAGAVIVQAGTSKAEAFAPKAKDAWDTVQCISARDVDCLSKTTWARDVKGKILTDANGKPLFDTSKLDPNQYIGKWTRIDPNSAEGKVLSTITKISQLPKVETIPLMKNRWALTWTAGKSANINYGTPTVVLTYVGTTPPFVSKVSYGVGSSASNFAGGATSGSGNYDCELAGIDRTVRVTQITSGCEAVYRRSDGKQEILWHSDHHPEICVGKAIAFVERMRTEGMKCNEV